MLNIIFNIRYSVKLVTSQNIFLHMNNFFENKLMLDNFRFYMGYKSQSLFFQLLPLGSSSIQSTHKALFNFLSLVSPELFNSRKELRVLFIINFRNGFEVLLNILFFLSSFKHRGVSGSPSDLI